MKIPAILTFIIFCCTSLYAQQNHVKLYLAPAIDTSRSDIAQVIKLWSNYLNSNPDSLYDNPNWLKTEKLRYKNFDFLNSIYFSPSLYYYLAHNKPTIMSVTPADSGFVIRTLFASQTDSGYCRPFCIIRIIAKIEDGEFRLCNILSYNTSSWKRETVGTITFIFPQSHSFNSELAQRLNSFVDSLTTIWAIKPFPTEFYLSDDLGEIMSMLGFDFYIGESYNQGVGGLSDIANRIVYGGGQNEWYPHEFVHIYINPMFSNAHRYFLEGYAALLGGSKGHDLSWHMKRMQQYLEEHQDLDLNNLLEFWHFDDYTDPQYVFGGLLCRLALQKGGLPTLKRLFSFGTKDSDFYKAIETVFGIKQQNLNLFIRTELTQYDSQ